MVGTRRICGNTKVSQIPLIGEVMLALMELQVNIEAVRETYVILDRGTLRGECAPEEGAQKGIEWVHSASGEKD